MGDSLVRRLAVAGVPGEVVPDALQTPMHLPQGGRYLFRQFHVRLRQAGIAETITERSAAAASWKP